MDFPRNEATNLTKEEDQHLAPLVAATRGKMQVKEVLLCRTLKYLLICLHDSCSRSAEATANSELKMHNGVLMTNMWNYIIWHYLFWFSQIKGYCSLQEGTRGPQAWLHSYEGSPRRSFGDGRDSDCAGWRELFLWCLFSVLWASVRRERGSSDRWDAFSYHIFKANFFYWICPSTWIFIPVSTSEWREILRNKRHLITRLVLLIPTSESFAVVPLLFLYSL